MYKHTVKNSLSLFYTKNSNNSYTNLTVYDSYAVSIASLYIESYLLRLIDKSNFYIFLYKNAAILLNSTNSWDYVFYANAN